MIRNHGWWIPVAVALFPSPVLDRLVRNLAAERLKNSPSCQSGALSYHDQRQPGTFDCSVRIAGMPGVAIAIYSMSMLQFGFLHLQKLLERSDILLRSMPLGCKTQKPIPMGRNLYPPYA
jgi:hypothetical protein